MAEGNETQGGGGGAGQAGGGFGSEGRRRASEADLLAERRARRAAESPEHILVRRAETAEATVRTLEAHVASLQQRLREAQEERRHAAGPAGAGGGPPADPQAQGGPPAGAEGPLEAELRRARQREYAEQRLRVETEERFIEAERDSRAQLERLSRQLTDSEAQERALAARVETLQRELTEAEQGVAAERAVARRAEGALGDKVAELEAQAAELRRELAAERAARLRAEETIEVLRLGHRRLELIAQELRAGMSELRAAAAAQAVAAAPAVARQWTAPRSPGAAPAGAPVREQVGDASPAVTRAGNGEMIEALAAAVERLRARVTEDGQAPRPGPPVPPRHKHSMSLIGRWRLRRKQRRGR
jgi:chaperonin cofactor prefoldin